jgi:hypothetical protein
MSRKGNCLENRRPAVKGVADDIKTFYNRIRRHSYLGGLRR